MKISILLPVFNTSVYLSECLDSILQQTEPDWELIAVDDFSTDNSLSLLKNYAKSDPRIHVFKNEKKGIAPALKMAFEKSTGDLITRMDSDDKMFPAKLEQLKSNLLAAEEGTVATAKVTYFSENGMGEGYLKYAEWLNDLVERNAHWKEIYKECPIPSPCWMAFRSDLEKCSAFQNDELYPEDYDLSFRFRNAGFKVNGCDEVLHLWRDRPERASRTDKNYQDNSFLKLKIDWFLKSDFDAERPLVIWGAGRKGKRLARLMEEQNASFGWVSNNQDKIGHEIRGVELRHFSIISQLKNPQIIIAVAAPDDQKEILEFLNKHNLQSGDHYFFFC